MSSNTPEDRQQSYRQMMDDTGNALGEPYFQLLEQFHHVVFFGDLNYRTLHLDPREALRCIVDGKLHVLRANDGLLDDARAMKVFYRFREPLPLFDFYPTYKKQPKRKLPTNYGDPRWVETTYRTQYKEPFYKGGQVHLRMPSFTDRILVHSLPDQETKLQPEPNGVCHNYGSVNDALGGSDHSAIYASFRLAVRRPLPCPPTAQGESGRAYYVELRRVRVLDGKEFHATNASYVKALFPAPWEDGSNPDTNRCRYISGEKLKKCEDMHEKRKQEPQKNRRRSTIHTTASSLISPTSSNRRPSNTHDSLSTLPNNNEGKHSRKNSFTHRRPSSFQRARMKLSSEMERIAEKHKTKRTRPNFNQALCSRIITESENAKSETVLVSAPEREATAEQSKASVRDCFADTTLVWQGVEEKPILHLLLKVHTDDKNQTGQCACHLPVEAFKKHSLLTFVQPLTRHGLPVRSKTTNQIVRCQFTVQLYWQVDANDEIGANAITAFNAKRVLAGLKEHMAN